MLHFACQWGTLQNHSWSLPKNERPRALQDRKPGQWAFRGSFLYYKLFVVYLKFKESCFCFIFVPTLATLGGRNNLRGGVKKTRHATVGSHQDSSPTGRAAEWDVRARKEEAWKGPGKVFVPLTVVPGTWREILCLTPPQGGSPSSCCPLMNLLRQFQHWHSDPFLPQVSYQV